MLPAARGLTLKLISRSLQQVTQFTSNTTKATSSVNDTTRDKQRDTDSESTEVPKEKDKLYELYELPAFCRIVTSCVLKMTKKSCSRQLEGKIDP